MPESIRIEVEEQSKTGEARRTARKLAREMGFDETHEERIAIVVTEACTNLLKHGNGGELLLRSTTDDPTLPPDLEMLALDHGPGMANLDQCLQDGFSTGGSPGQGLGAIVRLSTGSDFYSPASRGTALLARWVRVTGKSKPNKLPLCLGSVNACKPGQEVCGDSWGSVQTDDFCMILVADGLGHGLDAKIASLEAVRILHANPSLVPGALLDRVHRGLYGSRGAAVAVARIDFQESIVTFAGVGNISAQIYSGPVARQHLVSSNGTAGHQVQRIREFVYTWPKDGLLLMHSDGLSTNAGLEAHPGLASRDPTLIAGVLYRDFTRRNDDATVVVAKAA